MGISRIDHLYAETTAWEESAASWEGVGFAFIETWGSEGHRTGSLRSGEAEMALADVTGSEPAFHVFFAVDDAGFAQESPGVTTVTPAEKTHWGARWSRACDPEGRIHALEEGAA